MICNKCNHKLPDDSEFCQYCGNNIQKGFVVSTEDDEEPTVITVEEPAGVAFERPKRSYSNISRPHFSNVTKKSKLNSILISYTNISSIVLSTISILSIFIAMNVQDTRRNDWEDWNTTAVYFVLLVLFGVFLGFAINALIKKRFKLISCLSSVLVIVAIITGAEGSIFSRGYYFSSYKYYMNSDAVDIFNGIWVMGVVLIFVITLIPVGIAVTNTINSIWHKSITYREKCYKRVAKIHNYLEKGIISEGEYEKTKRDILKHIQ